MKNQYVVLILLILLTGCQKQNSTILPKKPLVQEQEALTKHNQLRAEHFNNAPLQYSLKLEKDAQYYANYLAETGLFTHDPSNLQNKYGENLYAFSRNTQPNLSEIIQKWYDEKIYYHEGSCQNGKVCGHYTQIVWRNSKRLGCASAQYKKGRFKNGYVSVCKYYPYGNIVGQEPY